MEGNEGLVPFKGKGQLERDEGDLLARVVSDDPETRKVAFVEYYRKHEEFPLHQFTTSSTGEIRPEFFETLDYVEEALQDDDGTITSGGDWEDMQTEIDTLREQDTNREDEDMNPEEE